jgi:hypothetical protein
MNEFQSKTDGKLSYSGSAGHEITVDNEGCTLNGEPMEVGKKYYLYDRDVIAGPWCPGITEDDLIWHT